MKWEIEDGTEHNGVVCEWIQQQMRNVCVLSTNTQRAKRRMEGQA